MLLTVLYILRSCHGTTAAELLKLSRSYTPGGGLQTAAQAAGSCLSSRKIEKETKMAKYYLICIDNHLFSCYTYLTKTKEVHYGTQ